MNITVPACLPATQLHAQEMVIFHVAQNPSSDWVINGDNSGSGCQGHRSPIYLNDLITGDFLVIQGVNLRAIFHRFETDNLVCKIKGHVIYRI